MSFELRNANGDLIFRINDAGEIPVGAAMYSGGTALSCGTINDGEFLKRVGSQIVSAAGGGGETNTGSNVGSAGIGVFDGKVGVDLQFRKLNALSSRISIALDTPNQKVDLDVPSGAFEAAGAVATHAADSTGVHGIADTAELVLTNDSRLSDARAPLSHTHTKSEIDDAGTWGIAEIPTGATSSTVCIGNDARLSDARTPLGHSHTAGDLPDLDGITAPNASVNFNGQQAIAFRVENRTSDPVSPAVGECWLRTDI